jgi:hypothetical protein
MKRSFWVVTGVLTVCLVVPARGDLTLGSISFEPLLATPGPDPSGGVIAWSYTDLGSGPWVNTMDIMWQVPGGFGGTSPTDHWYPGFNYVADMLTNGTDERLWVNATIDYPGGSPIYGSQSWLESEIKIGGTPGPGPDLVGCLIRNIEITPWLLSTGVRVDFSIKGVVVPVPGAALLGTIGLGVAGWRLRRREMA